MLSSTSLFSHLIETRVASSIFFLKLICQYQDGLVITEEGVILKITKNISILKVLLEWYKIESFQLQLDKRSNFTSYTKQNWNYLIFCHLCRGEGGELRLGIRRAVRPRNGLPDSVTSNQNSYPNVLSLAANAVATKSMFHVFYSPRYHLPPSAYFISGTNCIGIL